VATWNIAAGQRAAGGLGAVAEVLRGLDADVVAVQEVDRLAERSGTVDQARALGEALGMSWRFVPALLFDGRDGRGWRPLEDGVPDPGGPAYGVALLARTPPERTERLALPGPGPGTAGRRREPRVALLARVAAGGRSLTVAATHLANGFPWNAVQLRFLQDRLPRLPPPALLLGDLNLPAWAVAVAGRRGWLRSRCGATFPAHRPVSQLDHVLARRGEARLLGARTVASGASDHLPVVAEVALAGR